MKRSVVFLVEAFDGRTFHHQQKSKASTVLEQPLLHFPFIHLLANPCDFQSDMMVHPAAEEDFATRNDAEIPLAQQALYFLSPFRHLIVVHQSDEPSYSSINMSSSSNDTRMKEQLTQEFKLVVAQVLHLIHHFYSPVSVSSSLFSRFSLKLSRFIPIIIILRNE